MLDKSQIKTHDLVLKVSKNVDPSIFSIGEYMPFLEALCGEREYQIEAIETTLNFLYGGAYRDQRALAEECFSNNRALQEKYQEFRRLERVLQFPKKLACSVDLATGTGKSFVMYGLARIALASGKADRVLILCPSTTIERGLTDKFKALSADAGLNAVLPRTAVVRNAGVINATETIKVGDICIENIHATYLRTKSAIDDSFRGSSGKTLVLCDEAHHIYSPESDRGLKKWKEFLLEPDFNFQHIVGLSGTCYVEDEYFSDVIYRYSLMEAMEAGVVKTIDYVSEDTSGDQNENFQKILANHKAAKAKYRKIRPLTVLVTKDIATCKKLEDDLIVFLAKREKKTRAEIAQTVLRVHTRRSGAAAHEDKSISDNIERLQRGEPDQKNSPIEWIVSVSMLTEGWDAKNVFQIVPHEERAFESKLLIAQVLGRGLRLPDECKGEKPVVTVFNHARWSKNIKHLVDEILENEKKIYSFPVEKTASYVFDVHQIEYEKIEHLVESKQVSEFKMDKAINLATQRKWLERETTYERALTGAQHVRSTRVEFEMFELEHVVSDVHNKFKAIDTEVGSGYAKKYSREKIRALIRKSLDEIGYKGDEVSKENRQRILSSFGNLKRPGSKSIRYDLTSKAIKKVSIADRHRDSISVGLLLRPGGASVFFDDLSVKADSELKIILDELELEENRPASSLQRVNNSFQFKTCLSVVLTHGDPERKFVRGLIQEQNAGAILAWIKNADTGFYSIEYSYSRGEYSRRSNFNPDFFIRTSPKEILVVEIKGNEELKDPSPENRGKRKAASEHFERLNSLQNAVSYHFCFLCPDEFEMFFAQLKDGSAMKYQSALDLALKSPA